MCIRDRVDRAQALQIVFETSMVMHTLVECVLPGVAKGRMAKVVGKGNCFGKVLVELQSARNGACDLSHLKAMRQTGAEQIALVIDENLRLVFKAPEGRRVYDPVPVALKFATLRGFRVRLPATA